MLCVQRKHHLHTYLPGVHSWYTHGYHMRFKTCIPYSAKRLHGKTLANPSFQSFGEENIGEFKLLAFN